MDLFLNFSGYSMSYFFSFIILLIFIPILIYSTGYMNEYKKEYSTTYFWFFTIIFVLSMILTVFASNIISFMVFWEIMSISSFFLVIYEYKKISTIQTGIFYFIMTHISGLTLMIMFALLYKYTGKIYFSDMQLIELNTKQINIIFYLSIVGFGAKAGLIPLHAWLPKAHPAAPSNISSLMSGVMLKVAIYGFILVNFIVLNNKNLINGVVLLVIGVLTAVISILNAVFQKDIKALLAYSSAENVGIIFSTIALVIILNSQNIKLGALLALIAALYHILNHSVFKSLLFANAGSVLFATSTKNMNELGGLHKTLKYTTLFAFIGTASISAMPPFNGFASESLIFRSFIESTTLIQNKNIALLIVACLALLALTSSGAIYSAVKYFGITFLGEARSQKAVKVHKIPNSMHIGMGILSIYSILLGVLSPYVVKFLSKISQDILNVEATNTIYISNDIIYISSIALALTVLLVLISKKNKIENYETWGCGFNAVKPYMQYSGDGFSQPASRYFGNVAAYKKDVNKKENVLLKTRLHDIFYENLYKPIVETIDFIATRVVKIHYGKIQLYIVYILVALMFALFVSIKLI